MPGALPWTPCRGCAEPWRPSVSSTTDLCTACRLCLQCGTSEGRFTKWCSTRCKEISRWKFAAEQRSCRWCEAGFVARVPAATYCSVTCRRRAGKAIEHPSPWSDRRRANYHARRAAKKSTAVQVIRPVDVFERDGWVCGICDVVVDPDLVYPDPLSASLDHVVPLSRGGVHQHENVQCAHLVCNTRKGARVGRVAS